MAEQLGESLALEESFFHVIESLSTFYVEFLFLLNLKRMFLSFICYLYIVFIIAGVIHTAQEDLLGAVTQQEIIRKIVLYSLMITFVL